MTILIGADICPIEGNLAYFQRGDAATLFNDLLGEMERADLVIANLECPLIEQGSPIRKTGPVFGESSACIRGIEAAGIDVLCLANNHILDHGAAGLKNTMEVCAGAGIATVGAGKNLGEARRILIEQRGDLRVGILAMAEHEFSIAGKDSWGANPLDVIDFARNVKARRDDYDFLLVLVHGGHEFQPITPRVKDVCHFLVEMGANAVIVQHAHELGGYEEYLGAPIVYGQGALVMDEAVYRDLKSFHEGYLVKLLIDSDRSCRLEMVPFVQSAPAPGARRMSAEAEKEFRQRLEEKSKAISDDELVRAQWERFCERKKLGYLNAVLGHNRVLRMLNRKGFLLKWLHGSRAMLGVRNVVGCETHREALMTILDRNKD